MSFRGRLRLFFALIVIVPMIALGAVLFALTARTEMREGVEALQVPHVGGGGPLGVTASFGVASVRDTAADRDSLIAAADAALHQAKRMGKNRVERALTPVPEPSSRPR